jgi:hypothetical protein
MQVDMVADAWLLTQFDAIKGELDGIDAQHQYLHHLASQLEKACELIHKSYSVCRQFIGKSVMIMRELSHPVVWPLWHDVLLEPTTLSLFLR